MVGLPSEYKPDWLWLSPGEAGAPPKPRSPAGGDHALPDPPRAPLLHISDLGGSEILLGLGQHEHR